MEVHYGIFVNFKTIEGAPWLLPQLLICNLDRTGNPAYLQATALRDNMASFGFDPDKEYIKTLLEECQDLKPETMEAFFNRGKKKQTPLFTLFENVTTKRHIQDYVDRKIHKIILCVQEHQIAMTCHLKRKDHISTCLIDTAIKDAEPLLKFTKTQLGIQYSLKLKTENRFISPSDHEISILTHQYGWLVLDRSLIRLRDISAQKLTPFLQKDTLYIPDKTIRTYFEKFVIDIMSQVDIETEGFEIMLHHQAEKQTLIFVYDFMRHIWVVDVMFHYGREIFMASSPVKRKSRLVFDTQGHITVTETRRDEDYEAQVLDILYQFGFRKNTQNYFQGENEVYDSLHRVVRHLSDLDCVFEIKTPLIEGKNIALTSISQNAHWSEEKDWFDLKGHITVGDDTYPFSHILKYIKSGDPFFKLKDGSYALIPQEFFHTYDKIARFSEEYAYGVRLRKVHHTLLEPVYNNKQKNQSSEEAVDTFIPSALLKATLRPYQTEGVQWLIEHRKNGLGACLADDMGLGKTLQTLAALLDAREHMEVTPSRSTPVQLDLFGETIVTGRKSLAALIILPASLVYNWYQEIKKYCPSMQVLIYTGPKRHSALRTILEFDFILTTYQTVISDADRLKEKTFHYIVLDESHYIKNKDSKSFKVIHSLRTLHKISLTGTPLENSLSDLWSQMEFINPSILGSFEFFKKYFKDPIEKDQNEVALEELKSLIGPYILRRVKSEVAKDLPDLIETTHFSDMTAEQKSDYEKEKSAARNFIAGLDKSDKRYKIHVFTALMRLRQIANHPVLSNPSSPHESGKFEDIKAHLETILASGQKALIFSSFKSFLTLLSEWMKKNKYVHGFISGSKTQEERQRSVEAFQNDRQCQVLLITLKSGGTGLNLTAADYVFITEPWWNPFAEMQAVARAHRIGRQHNVVVKRFISLETIEEKISLLQSHKKSMAEDVLDVAWTQSLTEEDIQELFL